MHFIAIGILLLLGLILGFPMSYKPLSEDDGNWFYLPVFWKRGVRLYKNYSFICGYFGISQIVSRIYNALGFEKLSFFYFVKWVWYALTGVSIYLLSFFLGHDYVLAFIAGMLFLLITAVPNTLFVLTYAEHFFILPINLSIIFTYYGLTAGSIWYFMLAGLMSAWAVQIKPTALLFATLLPLVMIFSNNALLSLSFYFLALVGFNLLPLTIIRKYSRKAKRKYWILTFGPIIILLDIILGKLGFSIRISEDLMAADAYIRNHHNRSLQSQWLSIKANLRPAIKHLYLILVLGATQIVLLFVSFDPFAFAMVLLFMVFLLMVYFQKNYYTPHFNPCWAPISILAAKTIWDMWPYLLNSGALGWAMMVFMGIESINIGRIIVKSFSKSKRNTFGFLGPLLGTLFRLCESVGKYIQENSREDDKLFVWGDQPSIYLYAKREAFDTDYLIIYAHQGRILREKELLDSLREKPPELLLFYNYKVNDGWNIQRLQETIGIPYNHIRNFSITDDQRKSPQNPEGILYNFPLYRRDDNKYKEILLDRALIAKINVDNEEAQKVFTNILEMFPEDYEASIWLFLLENNGDGSGRSRSYLEHELSENNDSFKRPILLRLLADMDVSAGDSNGAMEKYEKALKINSSDFRSYNGLGELYFSQGNAQAALQSFQKAIELNPYSATVFNNIGVLLAQAGKRDDAIKCFQKALAFMPSHPDALNNMESLAELKGEGGRVEKVTKED